MKTTNGSGARRSSWRAILLATLVVPTGCADPAGASGSDSQVAISWMEWPGAVTLDQPGTVRIAGFHGACGTFQLSVTQSGPTTISVDAVMHFDTPQPELCPASIAIFDTTLPLPRLTQTPGGSNNNIVLNAPVNDGVTIDRRSFGYLALSSNQPDATLHAGGQVFVLPDSAGCSWLRPQVPPNEMPHVLSSDITLGSNTWHAAFASGMFAPALSPRCGQDPLFQAQVLEVVP